MKNITKYILIVAVAFLWACEPSVDSFTPSKGSADFSNYVAVGDSYTAGFTDGALGERGQVSGFSNILAKQLSHVGGNGFHQPVVESAGSVGSTPIAPNQYNSYFELKVVDGDLKPMPGLGDMSIFTERVYDADKPFQNLGVPGAKSWHLPVAGYAQMNPFYARFASDVASSSVLTDAVNSSPTFFSLWIGANDVLRYALEGGEGATSGMNDEDITPLDGFKASIAEIVADLKSKTSDGVIANIPPVGAIPYFNTVPYNALPLDQATADLLNGKYAAYNQAADANNLPRIEVTAGANALVIEDKEWPLNGFRQIRTSEKFLLNLPTSNIQTEGWGTAVPIPAKYVLTDAELKNIEDATSTFNTYLKEVALSNDLAHVDLYKIMNDLAAHGLTIDGHTYTTTFVSGGVFSLDGIHSTGKGSAIIANAFVDAINDRYNASVPRANVNDYDSVLFP